VAGHKLRHFVAAMAHSYRPILHRERAVPCEAVADFDGVCVRAGCVEAGHDGTFHGSIQWGKGSPDMDPRYRVHRCPRERGVALGRGCVRDIKLDDLLTEGVKGHC
jgi:hypothetical protein